MTPVIDRRSIRIDTGDVRLGAEVSAPLNPSGLILFAHGSGSGRHSPRNRYVAEILVQNGLATVLLDLLTREEETVERYDAHLRFNIPLLTDRFIGIADRFRTGLEFQNVPIGYFGSSTGAAAALRAAAERPDDVRAVVSRGGRPDLALDALAQVLTPTLLIVGGRDTEVIEMNRSALGQLPAEKKDLVIIPGATHLFEEPGALEEVAQLAAGWFLEYL